MTQIQDTYKYMINTGVLYVTIIGMVKLQIQYADNLDIDDLYTQRQGDIFSIFLSKLTW